GRKRVECWRLFQIARRYAETGMMQGANNSVAVECTLHQRSSVMRAISANRIKVSADTRHQYLRAIRGYLLHFTVRKFVYRSNGYVFEAHKSDLAFLRHKNFAT